MPELTPMQQVNRDFKAYTTALLKAANEAPLDSQSLSEVIEATRPQADAFITTVLTAKPILAKRGEFAKIDGYLDQGQINVKTAFKQATGAVTDPNFFKRLIENQRLALQAVCIGFLSGELVALRLAIQTSGNLIYPNLGIQERQKRLQGMLNETTQQLAAHLDVNRGYVQAEHQASKLITFADGYLGNTLATLSSNDILTGTLTDMQRNEPLHLFNNAFHAGMLSGFASAVRLAQAPAA